MADTKTIMPLCAAAQVDNDPDRLDYIHARQVDRTISTRMSAAEIRALGLIGGALGAGLLVALTLIQWISCWGQSYDITSGCKLATGLFWVYAIALVCGACVSSALLLWGHSTRLRAEAARAAITRDRYSNPVSAFEVHARDAALGSRYFYEAQQAEIQMAPYKQYPAGLDALSISNAAPKAEPPSLVAPSALPTAQWLAALEESPHLLIYGPSKAGKSTIAQAVVASFGACEYVVIDPLPNKPGEQKWGGIDFVTLCEDGDETASLRATLQIIIDEDTRRRTNMRSEIPGPLIVIIDEVLGLVDMLGTVRDASGKAETRMSQFIRKLGASARHRGIKIILIGQGKNLVDLGLSSGTSRNNYALVRAERNPATNERAAYIVMSEGEQPIDVRDVPRMANGATQSAKVWLSHAEAVRRPPSEEFLETLILGDFGRTDGIANAAIECEETRQKRIQALVTLIHAGIARETARDTLGITFGNEDWTAAGEMAKPKRGRSRAAR